MTVKKILRRVGMLLRQWVQRRCIVVGMTQGQVCVLVLQGWRKPRIAVQYEQAIQEMTSSKQAAQWLPYVQTLQSILSTHQLQHLPCTVVLPDRWIRWTSVSWMSEGMSSAAMSAHELDALVRLSFVQLYPDMPDWVSVMDLPRYGQSLLAAAIPNALLAALRAVLTSAGCQLRSFQSAHALAWNRAQSLERVDQAQLFATLEGQTLTLFSQPGPEVSAIRRVQVNAQPELPVQVIARELVLQQLQHPKVTVVSLNRLTAGLDVPAHWQVIDATNSQGASAARLVPANMSPACALCHLLSPVKSDKSKRKFKQWLNELVFWRSKALHLDFATLNAPPGWPTRQWVVAGALAAGLLLGNYVYLDAQIVSAQNQLEDAKVQQTARKKKNGPSKSDEHQNTELATARQVVASLNRPWERLFTAIEASSNPDVTLLDITPNAQGGDLHVSGDARNFKAVLAFVQTLKEQGSATQELLQVYLASHQVQDQDPLHTIRFEVNALWRPKDAPRNGDFSDARKTLAPVDEDAR